MSNKANNKAIFLDRDGVINVERSYISTPEELQLYPFTSEAIREINKAGYLTIVITNQSAIAQGMLDITGLEVIHKKLRSELAKDGAHVDAIYYCPHHPTKGIGEYKAICQCRKPNPGMLLKAAEEHAIDLSNSYFIGDSERDIIAGKKAGCQTIGVNTGYGLKESKIKPDFQVANLLDAVKLICNL